MDEQPVTSEEVVRTLAIQTVKLEKARQENARLAGELAKMQQMVQVIDAEVKRLREKYEPAPAG